jgi:hypothetical protein
MGLKPTSRFLRDSQSTDATARVAEMKAELGQEKNDPAMLQRSKKRNSPHPQAGIDGADDAKARVAAQEKVYKRQQKRVTGIQNASGGMDIVEVPMGTQSQPKNTKKSTRIIVPGVMRPGTGDVMDADGNIREINRTVDAISSVEPKARNLSNVMRGLSFGLSSLTTAALFSGQLTGEFGNTVLGATYALTALTEIANVARASGAIGLTGKFQGPLLAGKSGVTGSKITDFFKRMVTVGGKAVMSVGKFAGILGIAITVISGFIMLNNWINDQREKERLKIEGLGDAASLTSKQLKTLGNFYGKESVQTAFEAGGTNIGPASAEKRASIAKLSADENFQNDFKTTIATLKTSTTKQVKQAFESLSLTLFAQGYDTKTIQDIIDTLRVEAGKKDVVFEVASIDIKTKAGRANFNKSVDNLLKDYQDAFDKGSKKKLVVKTDTTVANMATGYGYEDTPELLAQTDSAATMLANNIDSVQTAFDNGQISLETYNELMDKAKTGMTSLNDEGKLAQRVFDIYKESVKENNPALYSLISNVKGAGNQFIVMQAIMSGAIGTVEDMAKVVGALAVVTDYLNGNAGGYSRAQFLKAQELIEGVSSKIKAATIEQQKLNDETNDYGGTGEESPFTKAKNDIVAQTKEIQNQIMAFRKLKASGIETDEAFKMASNSMFAAAIAAETVGTAKWKELVGLWNTLQAKQKALDEAEKQTLDGKVKAFEDGYSKIGEAFSAYEEQATASFNVTNKKDLDLIDEMNSKIAALQYKLDGWQSQLDDIQIKEDAINESYDKKIEALDKVAAINETLIAQQKSQLTIADALTRGDISAAAVAIQDAQAQNAAASAQDQKDRLETARQAALNGVTVGGKTRLQIEKEIKDTTAEIKKLEDESLKPAEERVRLAEEKLQKDIKSQLVAGKTKDEWNLIAGNIALAKTNTDDFVTSLEAALTASGKLSDALAAKTTPKAPAKATGSGKTQVPLGGGRYIEVASGGHITGPGSGTSDSIPAWLSNGEYVINAKSVKMLGKDFLDSINNPQGFAMGGKVTPKSSSDGKSVNGKESAKDIANRYKEWQKKKALPLKLQDKLDIFDMFPDSTGSKEAQNRWLLSQGFKRLPYLVGKSPSSRWVNKNGVVIDPNTGKPVKDMFGNTKKIPLTKFGVKKENQINPDGTSRSFLDKIFGKADTFARGGEVGGKGGESKGPKIFEKQNLKVGNDLLSSYGIKSNKFVFQGQGQDLPELSNLNVKVVPTTPEGLLSAALEISPKNKNIKSMLTNFQTNNIGIKETTLLDKIMASVSIGKNGKILQFERTDGFAEVISALTGNKKAKNLLTSKANIFKNTIAQNALNSKLENQNWYGGADLNNVADQSSVPVIHSTKYPIMRDKKGNVILYPHAYHNSGMSDYSRASTHFTLEDTVKSHLFGSWDNTQNKIVSPLSSMIKDNGVPYNLNSVDTWWMKNPGQSMKISNSSVITPYTNSSAYTDELIKRGLLKPGKMPPVMAIDPTTKDVLHLVKETYNSVDRFQIKKLLGRDVPKGQEAAALERIALQSAKAQVGIKTKPYTLQQWSLDDAARDEQLRNTAKLLGSRIGVHSGSKPELMEKPLRDGSSITSEMSNRVINADSIEAIRTAVLR